MSIEVLIGIAVVVVGAFFIFRSKKSNATDTTDTTTGSVGSGGRDTAPNQKQH